MRKFICRAMDRQINRAKRSNPENPQSTKTATFATYSDWRLPTQKELMQSYIDGFYQFIIDQGITTANYGDL
jgi:hypothetical protein